MVTMWVLDIANPDTFSICHDIFNGNWFIDVT